MLDVVLLDLFTKVGFSLSLDFRPYYNVLDSTNSKYGLCGTKANEKAIVDNRTGIDKMKCFRRITHSYAHVVEIFIPIIFPERRKHEQ